MSDLGYQPPDTIELGEVLRALGRGWIWIAGGLIFGGMVAFGVNTFGPIRYEATASVVLRDRTEAGGGQLGLGAAGALDGVADLFSLPGQMGSLVDTEVEILESRDLLNQISDAEGLQLQVRSPRSIGPDSLFSSVRIDPGIEEAEYSFGRRADGLGVEGDGFQGTVRPGETLDLPGASLTLRREGLPDGFRIRLVDRQDVVDRILKKELLSAEILGGDLAQVTFTARDAGTAARAANTAVDLYLRERRARMQGVTRNRLAVLNHLADSLHGELSEATAEYRVYQEAQEAFDPERLGVVERAAELRAQVDAMEVEARALDQVLREMEGDSVRVSDILAYPSFLTSDAINNTLDRIHVLQSERNELLTRRTEQDPDVIQLQETIEYLRDELLTLARSYRTGIGRQLEELGQELQRYREELASRPREEERAFELENEIERLTASYLGVQTQLVQARLASIGEGADLRQIDAAPPPKKPAFPIWWLNLAIGLVAGLILGVVAALVRGALSRSVQDARDLRRRTGYRVVTVEHGGPPLFFKGLSDVAGFLVLPLPGVGDPGSILDAALGHASAKARVLEGVGDPALAEALDGELPVVPLVRAGKTRRPEVEEMLEALETMGARVPGIVLLPR